MRTLRIQTAAGKAPRVERERGMQVNLFKWAKLASAGCPALRLLFAIPNGGARPAVTKDGRRFSVAAARMQAEGVKKGVPDIFLPVARCGMHGLWIELKAGKNRCSPEQNDWLWQLRLEGYAAFVVFDEWTEAKDVICGYLAGTLLRKGAQ